MFKLSEEGIKKVKEEMVRYETKESAVIPALFVAQEENKGFISCEVVRCLSELMEIPESRIAEVAQFYTLYNKKPVGKYQVQVCCNISCSLNGARELAEHIKKELKINYDEVTEDGRFILSKVECLGSCGTAPMMQVNDKYFENLSPEAAMNILRGLK